MSFLKKYSDILLIIALLVFAYLPLFTPGFFPIHDDEQIGRLYQLDKDVFYGQIPPRLAQDLGFGFDYPLFNFYPSFVYYIGEVFHLAGFSYITSTKLMIGLGFLLAGIFMYLFVKEYAGRFGGIIAATAYSYAPYHSVDVYVRGALPEFWSFVFIPALFWSYLKLAKTDKYIYFIVSSFFIAGLVLTHDLVAMMSSFFLGAFFLYLLTIAKKRLLFFGKICLSVILGLAYTAYFWIPGYFEKQYTMVNLLTDQLADYHLHFVYLKQFLNAPWGYGGSVLGLNDGLSFQIGQAQLLLAFVSIAVTLYFFWKKREDYGIVLLFLAMFLFSLFIQTQHSQFIWDKIQQFAYIQFPWRFLLFSDFTIAFLIAYIFAFLKNQRIQILFAIVMGGLLILLNKDYFKPQSYLTTVKDTNYTSDSVIRWRTSNMSFEYTPKGIATKKSSVGNTVIDIKRNEIPTSSFAIIRGKMSVKQLSDIPQQKTLLVSVSQPGLLRFNTFSFPGWKTFIDGTDVGYSDNNKYKLITIPVPTGRHTVQAIFTETPLRVVSDVITIISVFGIMLYSILRRKKYGKNK